MHEFVPSFLCNALELIHFRNHIGEKGIELILFGEYPDTPKAEDTCYQGKKKHKLFCKCARIEPTIGHLKTDYRLGRNFYKGVVGDDINVMLAAACNFKRAMKILLWLIKNSAKLLSKEIFRQIILFKE